MTFDDPAGGNLQIGDRLGDPIRVRDLGGRVRLGDRRESARCRARLDTAPERQRRRRRRRVVARREPSRHGCAAERPEQSLLVSPRSIDRRRNVVVAERSAALQQRQLWADYVPTGSDELRVEIGRLSRRSRQIPSVDQARRESDVRRRPTRAQGRTTQRTARRAHPVPRTTVAAAFADASYAATASSPNTSPSSSEPTSSIVLPLAKAAAHRLPATMWFSQFAHGPTVARRRQCPIGRCTDAGNEWPCRVRAFGDGSRRCRSRHRHPFT